MSLREVRRVVAQHEERAAGCDRAGGRPNGLRQLDGGQLQVEHGDEIEPARLQLVLDHVAEHPIDGDAAARRELCRLRERDVREVDARHPPSVLREPDGISALPARDIERAAGPKALDLCGEQPIRLRRPEQLLLRVATVPVSTREARANGGCGATVLGHAPGHPQRVARRRVSAISGTAVSNAGGAARPPRRARRAMNRP